jgi:two-component system sensor histidine kinase TctE
MRELINNLVDNAIKYTPTGGQVTVKCGSSTEGADGKISAFLEVQDNGPGLPKFEIARVTQRFYRVPGSPGVGNGLGLAIANEIVSLHNGTLSILSVSVGSGLRVRVLFKMEPKMIPNDLASL